MKILSDLLSKHLPAKEGKGVVVEFMEGLSQIEPTLSTELQCPVCGKKEHYAVFLEPSRDARKVWICADGGCESNKKKFSSQATIIPPTQRRALEWTLFCELSGIGDTNHDVTFEKIDQSAEKISYLLKFAKKPRGIIFMQGGPGSGKTYASLGVCEFFTRSSQSAIFSTQKQIFANWQCADYINNYISKIMTCSLLVIDDFGTGEISPVFMTFFMDLINTRMQWTDRGTIITTNLNDKDFSNYCGAALNDRVKTGQKFVFTEKTRRKPIVL